MERTELQKQFDDAMVKMVHRQIAESKMKKDFMIFIIDSIERFQRKKKFWPERADHFNYCIGRLIELYWDDLAKFELRYIC